MKASVRLREGDREPPLLRAKVPISILGLPFVSSFAAGDPSDLSCHLRTDFPSFPSLKLSFHPNPNPNSPRPFSLTLRSGIAPFGSPNHSPLLISARLSLSLSSTATPLFSIQIKPQFGDFSFKKTAAANSNPNPRPKENGGGIYQPIPVVPRGRTGLDDLISSGVAVATRTTLPVTRRAAVCVRWGVKAPWGIVPYLTVDKVSIESVEEEELKEEEKEIRKKKVGKEWNEKDLEAMKGMCFWMSREVEELQKENRLIKESIESVRRIVLGGKGGELQIRRNNFDGFGGRGVEKDGKKHVGSLKDGAGGNRASTAAVGAARR